MATKLTYFFLLLFFFPSFTAVKAQRVDNDTLYSQLQNYAITQNGKWVLIRKSYNGTRSNDTVYMVNTQNKKIQKEKVTNRIVFLNNSVVCIESAANQVSFLNLNTYKKWTLDHVTNLKLIPHNNLIFYLNAKTHRYCLSQISDDQEVVIWSEHQDQVTYHGFNPTNDVLLVQDPDNLTTIDLKTVEKRTVQQPNITIDRPFWNIKYPKVYLADENKQNNLLYCLDYAKGNLTAVDYSTLQSKPEKILQVESIDEHTALVNYVVLVGEKTYDTTQLELWATNDRYLDRKTRDESPDIKITKSAIFNYNTQELMPLDHLDNREPHVFNEHLILSHNTHQYDDYTSSQRFTDLRLYDITTQTTSTLAKHVQNIRMTVSVAPNRAFLVFKEGQTYYLYNTQTKSKTPIIDTVSVQDNQYWSKDSQRLYFRTQHGLFVYDLRTQTSKPLLEDKEGALELTLVNPTKEEFHSYYLFSQTLIDDTKIVVLAKNKTNNTSTLARIESQQEKTLLPWTTDRITAVVATDNANTITYSTENYTTPRVKVAAAVLQSDADGVFDTDGILRYSKENKQLIYTYYYKNQFILMNENLDVVHRQQTIDTTTTTAITSAHLTTGEHKMTSPIRAINAKVVVHRNLLFLVSTSMGQNESRAIWKQASIVDVYDFVRNNYVGSFYINHLGEDKLSDFLVTDRFLYGLFDKKLVRYHLARSVTHKFQ